MKAEQFQLNDQLERSHWWFTARRAILTDLITDVLPPGQGLPIVDVGCGTGGNIGALAGRYRCVGIDPSDQAIGLARQAYPAVQFIQGMAPEGLGPIAAESRLFVMSDVLEHVPDDFATLSGLLAAAQPGSYFLLTVPADMALWSSHDESHGHYRRYDRDRFAWLWRDLPVTQLLLTYYNSRLYPLVRGIRTVNRATGRSSGASGTDLTLPPAWINGWLYRVFAGESRYLIDVLRGRRPDTRRHGVSLVALLRREEGPIVPRTRPPEVPADPHTPDLENRYH